MVGWASAAPGVVFIGVADYSRGTAAEVVDASTMWLFVILFSRHSSGEDDRSSSMVKFFTPILFAFSSHILLSRQVRSHESLRIRLSQDRSRGLGEVRRGLGEVLRRLSPAWIGGSPFSKRRLSPAWIGGSPGKGALPNREHDILSTTRVFYEWNVSFFPERLVQARALHAQKVDVPDYHIIWPNI